jgi:hypothetical protein
VRGEVCTGFWWGNLRERNHWENPIVDGRIILKWLFLYCFPLLMSMWGNLREKDHERDPDIGGRINIKVVLHVVGCGSKGWVELAQD